ESGDGELTTQGNCSPHLSWPKTSMYYMWRGGVNSSYLSVSNRYYYSNNTSSAREYYAGARGGRTAE
ncbi:MAG: hypothetical protein RRX93_08455, partial [Bacteroidales bacterium]